MILSRESEYFRIAEPEWADALLLALRFKWKPIGNSNSFLAKGFLVTTTNAIALSEAFDHVFELALKDPLFVFTLRVDMGKLYLLNEFLKGGAFEIRS